MRPDEVLCVGLCTTLMGKVFSYMLVQPLVAPAPPKKLQKQNDSLGIKYRELTDLKTETEKNIYEWQKNKMQGIPR